MASSNSGPSWSAIDAQKIAAAESMLQHSRSARSNSHAFPMPDTQTYSIGAAQAGAQLSPMAPVSYSHLPHPFQSSSVQQQAPAFSAPLEGKLPSPRELPGHFNQQDRGSLSELSQARNTEATTSSRRRSLAGERHGHSLRDSVGFDESEPTSPINTRAFHNHQSDKSGDWTQRSSTDATGMHDIKDESDKKPSWSELKTKAGKDRKRLPLACIACRRKKIRCSGEKPSCKHCMRSRIPCVYKVTQRKAAPRTDYMAMLDKRLKRMEERVIKIIPKDEMLGSPAIPRAIIKSPTSQASHGKKRPAEEAFGPHLDEWAGSKATSAPLNGQEGGESKVNTEGAEFLPPVELQDHLSEVFFDNLYGQSYHVLHKPSYMRKLRYV